MSKCTECTKYKILAQYLSNGNKIAYNIFRYICETIKKEEAALLGLSSTSTEITNGKHKLIAMSTESIKRKNKNKLKKDWTLLSTLKRLSQAAKPRY